MPAVERFEPNRPGSHRPLRVRARFKLSPLALAALLLAGCLHSVSRDSLDAGEWPSYGNDAGGTRYSPLTEIHRGNVMNLRIAWTYRTGEVAGVAPYAHTAFEATPLMVDGTLFLSTPYNRVIALDPETGKERSTYDPKVDRARRFVIITSRGVATWLDTEAGADRVCRRRIYVATIDARLIALDAASGSACTEFGRDGTVDLTEGIKIGSDCACYQMTSPPAVVSGLVIVGSSIGDNRGADLERGVVRAYDARSGALRWSWDPIPTRDYGSRACDVGGTDGAAREPRTSGRSCPSTPRASSSSFRRQRDPDLYGGERLGDNMYANSLVALRAATGAFVWHFRSCITTCGTTTFRRSPYFFTLRATGDRFRPSRRDEDGACLPAPPSRPGRPSSRRGTSGSAERRPGKKRRRHSRFQPPATAVPSRLTSDEAWGINEEGAPRAARVLAALRLEGIFTPPCSEGTIIWPGSAG